jgi:endonuclease YncB( thermonuclease family)
MLGAASIVLRGRGGSTANHTSTVAAPTVESDFARYHDKSFRVVHVVDGDTLDIDAPDGHSPKTRIRLWGVDTPEIAHGGQPDMYFGPEAARFAHDTLDGRTVHVVLSPLDTRGKYGRLLAYVFLKRGGVMFNELLIERGYAYADSRFKHHYKDQFKQDEKHARRAGVGLWAHVTKEQMPAWRQRLER